MSVFRYHGALQSLCVCAFSAARRPAEPNDSGIIRSEFAFSAGPLAKENVFSFKGVGGHGEYFLSDGGGPHSQEIDLANAVATKRTASAA